MATKEEMQDVVVMSYLIHVAESLDEVSDELCEWILQHPTFLSETVPLVTAIECLSVAKDSVAIMVSEFNKLCGHNLDEWIQLTRETLDERD